MLKLINLTLIQVLVEEGYRILVLSVNNELQYWSFTEFTPNTSGSEPVEFCSVKGVDVTDFFNRESSKDVKIVVPNYEKFIEKTTTTTLKFSKNIIWQCFTK